jgi:hypothetical protein
MDLKKENVNCLGIPKLLYNLTIKIIEGFTLIKEKLKVKGVQALKKFILIGIGLLTVAFTAAYINFDKWSLETVSDINASPQDQAEAKVELKKRFEASTSQGEMPKYEKESEAQLLQEVHGMTHQKVAAEEKWGSTEITKDKVLKLYNVVQEKEFDDYEIQSMLLDTLEPWTHGDFSNAVRAHNNIWDYLHGNVGKASRLLTPVEEQRYIEKTLR